MAEATPAGEGTCSMGVSFDGSQWPACDPGVKGSVVIDNGGFTLPAPTHNIWVESVSDPNYSLINEEHCSQEYSFCPDFTKTPFNIRLESSSPNDYLCGVTTYDLVVLSRHNLGLVPILDPKIFIAADASLAGPNQLSGVTTNDVVNIKRCILGIQPNFGTTSAPAWWYFRENYVFNNPPLNPPYTGSNINPVPLNGAGSYGNFFAVKVGDLNHSCKCGMKPMSEEDAYPFLEISNSNIKRDENYVYVPVWTNAPFNLIAIQAGFRFDPSTLILRSIIPNPELDMSDLDFGLNKGSQGEVRFAWSPTDAQTPLPRNELLFTLKFEIKANSFPQLPYLWTSEDILKSLAYQEDGTEYPIRLDFEERGKEQSSFGFIVNPNPFVDGITVFFSVKNPDKAKVTLSDGKGFVFLQQTVELQSGDNKVELKTSTSLQPGIYFLTTDINGQRIQRRVVKI